MYEIGKETEVDELCPSCRKLPWGNGRTLEESLSILYNNRDKFPLSSDDVNAMIAGTIWDKHNEDPYCRECWRLVMSRLPSWMKGGH
jgi:hypothetical protein